MSNEQLIIKNKAVPELRFRGFNEDWVEGSLESITKKRISYGIVQAGPNISNGMPYIKSMDLNSELCIDGLERTSSEIAEKYKRSEVNPGDIVFSLRGNIGVSQVLPQTIPVANLTQGTARISIKNHFSETYFKHLLDTKNVLKKVLAVSKGSTFQEISLTDLRKLKIKFSESLKEQQKIASFLTAVDQRITLLKQKKAAMETYKKGLMQKIFNQEIRFKPDSNSPLSRGDSGVCSTQNSNNYPDWEEKALGGVTKVLRGKGLSKSAIHNDGKYPCILYGELFTKYNEVIRSTFSSTNIDDGVSSKSGDILMPTSDVTPKGLAKASALMINGVKLGGDMNILRPQKDILSIFLSYLLNFSKNKIIRVVSGTTVKHIYANDIKGIKVDIPNSIEEQQKIAECLSAIDQSINQLTKQINQTTQFKKGLLQRMFV